MSPRIRSAIAAYFSAATFALDEGLSMLGYHNELVGIGLVTIAVMCLVFAPCIIAYPFLRYRTNWANFPRVSIKPPVEFGEPIRGARELTREIWRVPVSLNTPGDILLRARIVLYSDSYESSRGKIRRDGPMIWLRWEDRENMGKGSSELTLIHGVVEKVPVVLWDRLVGAFILSEDVLLYQMGKWPVQPNATIDIQLIVKAHGKEYASSKYYLKTPAIDGDKSQVILSRVPFE